MHRDVKPHNVMIDHQKREVMIEILGQADKRHNPSSRGIEKLLLIHFGLI